MPATDQPADWVYQELGRLLDTPHSFGLVEPLPKRLEAVLKLMRMALQEAWIAKKEEIGAQDLATELSQDADVRSPR